MRKQIESILEKMSPITLEEMKDIQLMDRVDSKFVIPMRHLPELLEAMSSDFMVQTKEDTKIAPYTTQYFDTSDLKFFSMHQNGKLNRQKIRIRTYTDSNLSFLEIKNKSNKGRTSKVRVKVNNSHVTSIDELNDKDKFLDEHAFFEKESLVPILENSFKRITFVNNRKTERITIDMQLTFFNYKTSLSTEMDEVVILELKQDGLQRSDFREILNRMRVKPMSFSKYCMGITATNPEIKSNRFKKKIITLNKLIQK